MIFHPLYFLTTLLVLVSCQENPPVYDYQEPRARADGSVQLEPEAPCIREIRKKVVFNSLQLQAYQGCFNVTRDDCLWLHEAIDNCPCVCDFVTNSDIPLLDDLEIQPEYEFSQLADASEPSDVCFSADQQVQTSAGRMRMDELLQSRVQGLKVLAWNHELHEPVMSTLQYWLHADTELVTEFLHLSTFDQQHITLTAGHVLTRSETCAARDLESVMAEQVHPGDCLLRADGSLSKLARIERVHRQGIYAPMTKMGSIVVNDLVASCYAYEHDQHLLQLITWAQNTFRDLMGLSGQVVQGESVPVPYFMGALKVLKPYFHAFS